MRLGMSNSRWRVIGVNEEGIPYSTSGFESEKDAQEKAEYHSDTKGWLPFAVMPESESVPITHDKKEAKLVENMEKVLHQHPEWFFDGDSEDRYMEWRKQQFTQTFSTPGPRKPKPQLPPEVWRVKPEVDTTDYMAAVRAMCGGSGKGE